MGYVRRSGFLAMMRLQRGWHSLSDSFVAGLSSDRKALEIKEPFPDAEKSPLLRDAGLEPLGEVVIPEVVFGDIHRAR